MVRPSGIWKYFDYVDERFATCKACNGAFSHSSSSTNLRKHLASKHPEIDLYQTRKYTKPIKHENGIHKHSSKINMAKRKSFIWQHYRVINHSVASCNVCQKRISYKTSISNLKKHMIKRHPLVNLNESTQYEASSFMDDYQDDDINDYDDDSFPDDTEEVKALLGLTGAKVEKTIEIIEEVDDANLDIDCDDSDGEDDSDSDHNNYDNDSYGSDNQEDEEDGYKPNNYIEAVEEHTHNYNNGFFDKEGENKGDLVIKRTLNPNLKKFLEEIEARNRREPTPEPEIPRDPIDLLVENFANKLRKMPEKQFVIAEYKIQEILYLGLSNSLKEPHQLEVPQNNYTITTDAMTTLTSL